MQKIVLIALCALAGAVSSASAEVQISLQNGRVTILAKDATVRQILTEWARVGQTKIVNVERIPGTPLTIELRDVPEQQALKTLLRSISGYMTAPRTTTMAADTSVFDRIIVMPTLAPAAAPLSAAPPPTAAPVVFTQQQPPPLPEDQADDQRPTGAPQPPANRGPVFVFPQPQVTTTQPPPGGPANPSPQAAPPVFFQQPAAPTAPPSVAYPGAQTGAPTGAPAGVAVPGMVVPAPAPQPGQPPPQQ
jgi:hypothetical protein